MLANLDPVLLARIQFAFTVSFHIIFPAFTIGLASWLAVVEWRYLKTGNDVYQEVYRMWVKIFAVTFGMGVVSGVVMSYQFGTNWSVFADKTGNVLGPLLGYEVLTAFFLEASFLGVMLFGWNRVGRKMHFASTVIVAFGTLLSSFWILAANSWMQTPQGYRIGDYDLFYPTDWLQVIFNPSFPYRFAHMVVAAYLTTAFVVGGIGAYYLWRKQHIKHARVMFGMAMIMAIFVAPMQPIIGDLHGLNTLEHQPAKVAAMEGLWETQRGAPLKLFGWPDQEQEQTKYALEGRSSLAIVGGIIEPGEAPETAARREVQEEMQLECREFHFLGRYRTDVNRGGGWTNTYLATHCDKAQGELEHRQDAVGAADTERQDLRRISLHDLREAVLAGNLKW